jgi:hypothetical protein
MSTEKINNEFDFFQDTDLYAFKKHLTEWELAVFHMQEEKLEREHQAAQLALINKYNDMVSERMSKDILVEELQKVLNFSSGDLISLLNEMDNKTLQAILSVVACSKKEMRKDS